MIGPGLGFREFLCDTDMRQPQTRPLRHDVEDPPQKQTTNARLGCRRGAWLPQHLGFGDLVVGLQGVEV